MKSFNGLEMVLFTEYDLIGNNINICTADNLGTKFNFPYCKESKKIVFCL